MSTTFRLQHALDWASKRREAEHMSSLPHPLRPTIQHVGRVHHGEINDACSIGKITSSMLREASKLIHKGRASNIILPTLQLPTGKSPVNNRVNKANIVNKKLTKRSKNVNNGKIVNRGKI